MASYSVSSTTSTSATIALSGLNSAYTDKKFTCRLYGSEVDSFSATAGTTYSYTYTGLTAGTAYTFSISVEYWVPGIGYASDADIVGSFTTDSGSGGGGGGSDPDPPSPTYYPDYDYVYDDTSVTIYVYDASGYYLRYYLRLPNGTVIYDTDNYGRSRLEYEKTITGLTPNTTYILNVGYSEYSTGGVDWIGASTFTTDAAAINIATWDWNASNGYASANQTRTAYNAVTGQGYLSDFSYLVWNDIVDKVKEILDAIGEPWEAVYLSYSNTRMNSSDKAMTAARYNSVVYQIWNYYGGTFLSATQGGTIYGSLFTDLTARINAWIVAIS